MQTASLAKYHPRLQGIFGPLSKPRLEYIWQVLTQIDVELLRLAAHFGHNSAGWEKTGLELSWAQSGQLFLGSFVGTTDPESHAADFVVELWPSWCTMNRGTQSNGSSRRL